MACENGKGAIGMACEKGRCAIGQARKPALIGHAYIMKLTEKSCIATPGFAGFVPSLRYQFGDTYGNATRRIRETDPTLKCGNVHQKRLAASPTKVTFEDKPVDAAATTSQPKSKEYVWRMKNKYQTGDDRASFPPVPGYTGFIPRSSESFGRPYVEATKQSIAEFNTMRAKSTCTPQVASLSKVASRKPTARPTFLYSAASDPVKETSPYKPQANGDPNGTYIRGYTGFVPRMQMHFGQPYSKSAYAAIKEFNANEPANARRPGRVEIEAKPIPGSTVFIPGSKYGYATTFGKASELAYDAFNRRDARGRVPNDAPNSSNPVVPGVKRNKPISGYRGHIPGRV